MKILDEKNFAIKQHMRPPSVGGSFEYSIEYIEHASESGWMRNGLKPFSDKVVRE